MAALERLEVAVRDASNFGVSKKAEISLRKQARILTDLKMHVSYLDKPAIDKILARVAKLHQEILYSIMNPPQRTAKK
ncbi:MAG: hypothetical protein HY313_09170 [Acidobacteria bacterium]|nr:hypothetical protein [Acidobacteriota bacterium]